MKANLIKAKAKLQSIENELKAVMKLLEPETEEHGDVMAMVFSGKAATATIDNKLKRKR